MPLTDASETGVSCSRQLPFATWNKVSIPEEINEYSDKSQPQMKSSSDFYVGEWGPMAGEMQSCRVLSEATIRYLLSV